MPINFTVNWDANTNNLDDSSGDISATTLIGPVRLITQLRDGEHIPAPGALPRPTSFAITTFTGFLDSDGRLKDQRGGTVGMRVWANDPIFNMARLQYRVEAELTDPIGRVIPLHPFSFDAPSTDSTVNLAQQMPSPGQDFTRGRPAYDVTNLSLNGSNQFVFTREDGFALPPVSAAAVVNLTPTKGRAVAMAIALK